MSSSPRDVLGDIKIAVIGLGNHLSLTYLACLHCLPTLPTYLPTSLPPSISPHRVLEIFLPCTTINPHQAFPSHISHLISTLTCTTRTGPAGLTAIKSLREAGFVNIQGFERRDSVGGVWSASANAGYTSVIQETVANTSRFTVSTLFFSFTYSGFSILTHG